MLPDMHKLSLFGWALPLLLWIKLVAVLGTLVLAVVWVFGLYVGVVSGAANMLEMSNALRTTAPPPSPEDLARSYAAEVQIQASIQGSPAFYLELNDEELTALLAARTGPDSRVRELRVHTTSEGMTFSGSLNGVIDAPFSGDVHMMLEKGEIHPELARASVGVLEIPDEAQQDIEDIINQSIDDTLFRRYGDTLVQQVRLEEGRVVIVGVQQTGTDASWGVKTMLQEALEAVPPNQSPVPPGGDVVPPGAFVGKPGDEIYLALGDSLAANVGVSDARQGYVSRFHSYLERETGRSLGLVNRGIPGESSISILKNQLPRDLREIEGRRDDGNAATRVSVVTLDLGANDLLVHLKSEDCLNAPASQACQSRLDAGLDSFRTNFREMVPTIAGSVEPDTEFYIMTLYNPFDLGTKLQLETLSNEVTDELNSVIREAADEHNVMVADVRPLMASKSRFWTHILNGDIHPNSNGYQVLAYSLAEARQRR
jgi:lysophospholipase L1-like esterase